MPDFSFVHAADLHLDTPFKGIGSTAPGVAEQLREASLTAFDFLVDLCLERRAAFLVIAGDIYDGPERGLRAQLRFRDGLARLSAAGIPSFVVHGNHDPVETGWSAIGGQLARTGARSSVPERSGPSRSRSTESRPRPCRGSATPTAGSPRTWRSASPGSPGRGSKSASCTATSRERPPATPTTAPARWTSW